MPNCAEHRLSGELPASEGRGRRCYATGGYTQRAAPIECTNAQPRRQGPYPFLGRGQLKARGVLRWHALAHNLVRMRRLDIAFQL